MIAKLAKNQLDKTWKVGTIDLSTKITHLKPSNREFGLEIKADTQWNQFKTNVSISFLAQNEIYSYTAKTDVAVALTNDTNLSFGLAHRSDNSLGRLP